MIEALHLTREGTAYRLSIVAPGTIDATMRDHLAKVAGWLAYMLGIEVDLRVFERGTVYDGVTDTWLRGLVAHQPIDVLDRLEVWVREAMARERSGARHPPR